MTREELDRLSGTDALRVAGLRHQRSTRSKHPYDHDVYRISDDAYVATISAHDAHDLAARTLGLEKTP